MKKSHIVFSCILAIAVVSCQQGQSDQADQSESLDQSQPTTFSGQQFSFDWENIAGKIVERAGLQPGERVLLVGKPGDFDPLITALRSKIQASGAEDLGAISVSPIQPPDWSTVFTNNAEGKNQRELEEYFRQIDLGIMMPGAVASDLAYRSIQNILDEGGRRTIHFHWTGAYSIDMTNLPLDDKINATYQHALLETDYARLGKLQKLLEVEMRDVWVSVTTPAGTDLKFRIGDRPVTKQDGDASAIRALKARNLIDREIELPAGAVRIAPVEGTVSGVIRFPDAEWNGTRVEGLSMKFEAGRVTNWSAETGSEAVQAELDSGGETARSFREFALGLNPLLAIPDQDPWIPYYGYGAGVVRLSLGDNLELGGAVGGGYVRWNFFTDATVTVRDEVWVRDGILQVQ